MTRRNRHNSNTKPYGTELLLSSGFRIFIKPLPPYYLEIIEDVIPLPEYPRRKIVLASGDIIDWEYTPPEIEPDIDNEDYELWMNWKAIDDKRKALSLTRRKARQDFLLANCVEIIEGPISIADITWSNKLEAVFDNFKMPLHPGKRLLYFLKSNVITTPLEMETIIQLSVSEEVAMQGILSALHGFQPDLGQGQTN